MSDRFEVDLMTRRIIRIEREVTDQRTFVAAKAAEFKSAQHHLEALECMAAAAGHALAVVRAAAIRNEPITSPALAAPATDCIGTGLSDRLLPPTGYAPLGSELNQVFDLIRRDDSRFRSRRGTNHV